MIRSLAHPFILKDGGAHWARQAQKLEKLQRRLYRAIYESTWMYLHLLGIFSPFSTYLGCLFSIISPVINEINSYIVLNRSNIGGFLGSKYGS